jgi:hypothetical protein
MGSGDQPRTQEPRFTVLKRVSELEHFLQSYNSPMAGESGKIVAISNVYDVDYMLIVGIAGMESLFETAGDLTDYNPYGLGCSDAASCLHFATFAEATEALVKNLTTNKAYRVWQKSGKLEDLASVYLTGDQDRWVTTVLAYITRQKDKLYE